MALEELKAGHRKALQVVDRLEAALGLLRRGEAEAAAATLRDLLGFLDEEQRVHFRQEEEGLFLYLAWVIGEGPVQAMVGEHESYWKAVAHLKALLAGATDAAELGRLLEHLTALLRGHIHREEAAYFPLAEKRLSARQLREMAEEIAAIGRLG